MLRYPFCLIHLLIKYGVLCVSYKYCATIIRRDKNKKETEFFFRIILYYFINDLLISIAGSQQLLASACIEFLSLYIIVIKLMSDNSV